MNGKRFEMRAPFRLCAKQQNACQNRLQNRHKSGQNRGFRVGTCAWDVKGASIAAGETVGAIVFELMLVLARLLISRELPSY